MDRILTYATEICPLCNGEVTCNPGINKFTYDKYTCNTCQKFNIWQIYEVMISDDCISGYSATIKFVTDKYTIFIYKLPNSCDEVTLVSESNFRYKTSISVDIPNNREELSCLIDRIIKLSLLS